MVVGLKDVINTMIDTMRSNGTGDVGWDMMWHGEGSDDGVCRGCCEE